MLCCVAICGLVLLAVLLACWPLLDIHIVSQNVDASHAVKVICLHRQASVRLHTGMWQMLHVLLLNDSLLLYVCNKHTLNSVICVYRIQKHQRR